MAVPGLNILHQSAARLQSLGGSSPNVTFKVRRDSLGFCRSHQVFMGILATRVKFFLRLQNVNRARGD